MLRGFLARTKATLTAGERPSHASSILLPFLIISIALGALAWRSYSLSERMERGANTIAMQYAGYAADTAARRLDSAVRGEVLRVSEEWQQLERGATPTEEMLHTWVGANDWIISAIYVPDADPTASVFVSEPRTTGSSTHLTRDFYTAGGLVRYTYDPGRLLAHVRGGVDLQPLLRERNRQPRVQIDIIPSKGAEGPAQTPDGFLYTSAMAQPLAGYSIRAFVPTAYGTSGWENARRISGVVSLLALALTALGGYLALRGLHKEEETMKLRGALIANVSHELRTPLSMIRLGAETLKRSSKLSEKQRVEIEDSILREVLHLSHLVENVLDVARIQNRQAKALAFAPVYPRELVAAVIATYESWIRSRGFDITTHIDDTIDEQLWDRDAVSRALLNLIDNAMKYSADDKVLHVALRQSEEHVVIEVRDRGVGIDEKDLTRIFDPYYRAQFSDTQTRRGAGLGLTLVQQIVTSHGGRIDVESAPGNGSTFRLLFPRGRGGEAQQTLPRLAHAPQAF